MTLRSPGRPGFAFIERPSVKAPHPVYRLYGRLVGDLDGPFGPGQVGSSLFGVGGRHRTPLKR